MYIKIIYSLFFSFILINSHAQELNCQVIINTSQIQGSANKQIFDQLQKSIFDFVNNRKWSNDIFGSQEKINCTFQIIINKSLGSDEYSASIQVESARPIYKSAYSSTKSSSLPNVSLVKNNEIKPITKTITPVTHAAVT